MLLKICSLPLAAKNSISIGPKNSDYKAKPPGKSKAEFFCLDRQKSIQSLLVGGGRTELSKRLELPNIFEVCPYNWVGEPSRHPSDSCLCNCLSSGSILRE